MRALRQKLQWDEDEGKQLESYDYGGAGYEHERPDRTPA